MHPSPKTDWSATRTIPFPKRREMLAELRELDTCFRSLREKIENGAEVVSVARSAALLYVDFLARIDAFSTQLDLALGNELFVPGWTLEKNIKRGHAALSMYAKLMRMMHEVIARIFGCLGGQMMIEVQAMAHWVAQHPEAETMVSALEQQIQRIERILARQSK